MIDVILETLLDTAKILPFLFLTYLLMEFLEHRSGDAAGKLLRRSGKIGPLLGGVLGVLPQCGFSAAASGLYAGRLITAGTLVAVYLSTSDEMLPILISNGTSPFFVLAVLGCKLTIGVLAGFLMDACLCWFCKPSEEDPHGIEDLCEREHCRCDEHFVRSALRHTLHITLFLLLVNFLLNLTVFLVGEDTLAALVFNRPVLGNLLAAVVGLIPNCASSVVLTELYLSGVISIGSMLSGLLVNAGVGLLVLFRNNRPVRDSLRILLVLWCVGAAGGLLVDLTPLSGWLNLLR